MALRYLLDTNICIYFRQGRLKSAAAHLERLEAGEIGISVVTLGELCFGVVKSKDIVAATVGLRWVLSIAPAHSLPTDAGRIYGELRAGLEKDGAPIGSNDLWIAAHALASGLTLVTNNVREFRRVPKLKIENWAK